MAANLSGMFAQLNNAVNRSPLAQGGMGAGMLDMASQGLGGAMGNVTGRDPYSFMSQGGKGIQGQKDLAGGDLTSVEGLRKAAITYQQMGNPSEALKLTNQAQAMEDNQKKEMDDAQIKMNLELGKKQAMKIALQRGDREAHAMLKSGHLDPGSYIATISTPTKGVVVNKSLVNPVTGKEMYTGVGDPKAESFSTHGKIAEDLGYSKGSPEYLAYIAKQTEIDDTGIPLSTKGKELRDAGAVPGSQEFQQKMSQRIMADTPRAWEQFQEVSSTIGNSPEFKKHQADTLKARSATTFLSKALEGNTKAIPLLESSMATLIQSSVKAQAEIENIRASNDVAGRFLDSVSKGITGQLTSETLTQYSSIISAVLKAAGSAKSDYVNNQLKSARTAGMPEDVVNNVRDSFGVTSNRASWADR